MHLDLHRALATLDIPADWIGLREVRETQTTRYVRDGHPQSHGQTVSRGVAVEVLAGGQFGYAATNQPTLEALQAAARRAYAQAAIAAERGLFRFTPQQRPPVRGRYAAIAPAVDMLTSRELHELLAQLCQDMQVSDRIVRTNACVATVTAEQHFVSSNGTDIEQSIRQIATDFAATAQDGNVVQRRGDGGWFARCSQAGIEILAEAVLRDRVRQVAEQAIELLTAEECPTAIADLVLAPDQMMLQIHESIGHPLELDRILGDERNYAGGSFVKLSDFGTLQYGSPLLNVTFDPTVAGQFASYGFDDTGLMARREYLIREGVLLRGLGGTESQVRAGVDGVACARASSWNRPAIDRMANINLEPGNASFDEIVSDIESGVYMESNRSWSIDDYRHKFQFGCEYAKRIENGKLTKTLRNPNYRGTTPQFWHSLAQVGDRSTMGHFGSPFCGKGEPNQLARVGHASPACLFKNIEVFGGAG